MSEVIVSLRVRADLVIEMRPELEARLKELQELERKTMNERWEVQGALRAIEQLERRKV